MATQEPERSTAADNLWNTNPDLHTNEILNNIKAGASRGTSGPSMSYMLAPFAALLVKLSRDADATATKTLTVTNRLYWLTWALLALTFFLFAKEAMQFYEDDYLPYHQSEKANQNTAIKNHPAGNGGIGIIRPAPANPGAGPG